MTGARNENCRFIRGAAGVAWLQFYGFLEMVWPGVPSDRHAGPDRAVSDRAVWDMAVWDMAVWDMAVWDMATRGVVTGRQGEPARPCAGTD
jgi:hypothetical protein